MKIVTLILIGLLGGIIAKLLMPGKDPGGLIVTILLGVAGSFVGAFVASAIHLGTDWFTGFAMSVIGAMLLLALYRFVVKATTSAS